MAENPTIKRYLDAGMAFTQMTQTRAEAIVKDLVKAGEVQTNKAQDMVAQIIERNQKNTEKFLEMVRKEIRDQVASLGLATKDDLAKLEKKLDAKAPAKKAPAKRKAAKKKATAKKATAKKAAGSN